MIMFNWFAAGFFTNAAIHKVMEGNTTMAMVLGAVALLDTFTGTIEYRKIKGK